MLEILLVVGLLIEAVIEAFVQAFDGALNKKQIIAFFVGGILLWAFGIDVVLYLGLVYAPVIPVWVGQIISAFVGAVLIFRFSGNFNDLWEWLNGLRP